MPIRPENRHHYENEDWRQTALELKQRAGWRCQCDGRCGRPRCPDGHDDRCTRRHGQLVTAANGQRRFYVVLTVAHLDHDPSHHDEKRLMVMCQGCHLHYDIPHHAQTRVQAQATAMEAAGQTTLPLDVV